jgi:hypothetical protein
MATRSAIPLATGRHVLLGKTRKKQNRKIFARGGRL